MAQEPDTSVIEFHRVPDGALAVRLLAGDGALVAGSSGDPRPLVPGTEARVGDTVVLEPGARAQVGPLVLQGGRRGMAHGLVRADAFRPSPSRDDVPRLLAELGRLGLEAEVTGHDPFEARRPPRTPADRAIAASFALDNLDLAVASTLPGPLARALGAVPLFVSGDTVFVAVGALTVRRLATLVQALQRPVEPHLVDGATLEALLARLPGA